MKSGKKIEDVVVGAYRMVFLKVTQQTSFMQYHYRLIVFPKGKDEAVLSLNLESNPTAGTCCLGAHLPEGHDNLGSVEQDMPEGQFRKWAFDTAEQYLGLSETPPPVPEGGIRVTNDDADSATDLTRLVADSFQFAHEYVDFRNRMNTKAGGFLGMFRKSDYGAINSGAIQIESKASSLLEKALSVGGNNAGHALILPLREYAEALCVATALTRLKTDLMLQLFQKPGSVPWADFNAITQGEEHALDKCQATGDRLTTLFRAM